jgi:hypothetical protein
VRVSLDLAALGLGANVRAFAPGVEGLQTETEVDLSAVRVPVGQGLFVVVGQR